MGYWLDQIVGEAVFNAIDSMAAGSYIVYLCLTGTGGMCR